MQAESLRDLDWRGWIDRYLEMVQWDLDLTAANEMGLHESLRGLFPELRREFAHVHGTRVSASGSRNLDGDRPPLSIDIVERVPHAGGASRTRRRRSSSSTACGSTSGRVLEPVHRAAVRHRDHALLRRAAHRHAVRAQRAVQRPLSRTRSPRAFPTGGASARTRRSTRTSATSSRRSSWSSDSKVPVKYDKISSSHDADELERRLANAIAPEGISAFVFNFVDLLTHGRSESAILYEVARDEIALRQLTLQWFKRSALFSVLQEARAPEGEGARHERPRLHPLPHAGHRVRASATRRRTCATSSARTCAPRIPSWRCCSRTRMRSSCRAAAWARTRCSPPATASSCIPPSCANTRAATAARSCTAASRRRSASCRCRS